MIMDQKHNMDLNATVDGNSFKAAHWLRCAIYLANKRPREFKLERDDWMEGMVTSFRLRGSVGTPWIITHQSGKPTLAGQILEADYSYPKQRFFFRRLKDIEMGVGNGCTGFEYGRLPNDD